MTQRTWWLSGFAILLLAAVLRFWQLGRVPVSLYWDEMAIYVDVKSVLATGQDMHGRPWTQLIYPSYGDYKLAPYIWAVEAASKVFGLSEWSVRFPSVLAGIATVVLAGLIAVELFPDLLPEEKKRISLSTMLVVALLPWSLQFSRTGFEGHFAQMWFALSVFCGLRARKNLWWMLPAVLAGTIATYTYYSVRFVWPVVAVGLLCWVLWQMWTSHAHTARVKLFENKAQLLKLLATPLALGFFAIVVYLLSLLPLQKSSFYPEMNVFRLGTASVLSDEGFVDQANLQRLLAGNTIVEKAFFHRDWFILRALLKNYSDHLSLSYLFLTGDPNLRHGTAYFGILLLGMAPLFLYGMWQMVKRFPSTVIFLLVWWLIALLPASIPENTPHALRSLNALVPVAVLVGFGLAELWTRVEQSSWTRTSKRLCIAALLNLLLLNSAAFLAHYFTVYPVLSADDWQAGYKPLAQEIAIEQNKNPDLEIYVLPFDDRFYLWLMGYGKYTPQDFHSWHSEGFHFDRSIPHLHQQEPDLKDIQGKPVLIAGEVEQLKTWSSKVLKIASDSAHVTYPITELTDEVGRHSYGVILLNSR